MIEILNWLWQFLNPPHSANISFAIPPLAIAALVMAAAAGTKAVMGATQASAAKKNLKELGKVARPEYETGESIYDRADARATGLTPEERARALQGFSQLNNTRFKLGTQRNPTLTGAVQAGINYGSPTQTLGLAAQDAQVRRQSLNQLINLFGGQSNRQAASDISYRNETERALGQAHSRGVENVSKGIDGIANAGAIYAGGAAGGGVAGAGAGVASIPAMSNIPLAQPQSNMGLRTQMTTPYPTYPMVGSSATPTDWNNPYGAQRENNPYSLMTNYGIPYRPNQYGIPSVYAQQ